MALRLPAGATARVRPYKLRRYGAGRVAAGLSNSHERRSYAWKK